MLVAPWGSRVARDGPGLGWAPVGTPCGLPSDERPLRQPVIVLAIERATKAKIVEWVHRILKEERDIVIASPPLEATTVEVKNIRWPYIFYENGLSINVVYTLDNPKKRAVGFKLSEGMEVPAQLGSFKFTAPEVEAGGDDPRLVLRDQGRVCVHPVSKRGREVVIRRRSRFRLLAGSFSSEQRTSRWRNGSSVLCDRRRCTIGTGLIGQEPVAKLRVDHDARRQGVRQLRFLPLGVRPRVGGPIETQPSRIAAT